MKSLAIAFVALLGCRAAPVESPAMAPPVVAVPVVEPDVQAVDAKAEAEACVRRAAALAVEVANQRATPEQRAEFETFLRSPK